MGDDIRDFTFPAGFGGSGGGSNLQENVLSSFTGKPTAEDKAQQQGFLQSSAETSQLLADLSRRQFEQVEPLRGQFAERGQDVLSGNFQPSQSPAFAAGRATADPAFAAAKENILATLPSGGGLQSSLGELEGDKARTLTGLSGDIFQDELNKAFSLASGLSTEGLGTAGSNLGQLGLGQGAVLDAQQAAANQNTFALGSSLASLIAK